MRKIFSTLLIICTVLSCTTTAFAEDVSPEAATTDEQWVKVEGSRYYIGKNGNPVTGWNKIKCSNSENASVKWCYFDSDGVLIKSYKATKKKKVSLTGSFGRRYVDRWIGFIGYEYGFHDCYSWRDESEFDNKDTYLSDGSYGCVNMKLRDIKFLYKNINVGDKVIIRK